MKTIVSLALCLGAATAMAAVPEKGSVRAESRRQETRVFLRSADGTGPYGLREASCSAADLRAATITPTSIEMPAVDAPSTPASDAPRYPLLFAVLAAFVWTVTRRPPVRY